MRNLLLILISGSLILTQTSQATEVDDCREAIKSAEVVINKQGELIDIMHTRNDELFKEKTDLEVALLDAREATVKAEDHEVIWGVVGVVIGVLATGYALRNK